MSERFTVDTVWSGTSFYTMVKWKKLSALNKAQSLSPEAENAEELDQKTQMQTDWDVKKHLKRAIVKKGNGKRGMRLTIYHMILHSEQFEGAEFIDGNNFLWFLTPVNNSSCHLPGHKFGRRTANASILMKLCILHKSKALSSMVTIVLCSFWRPPVKFDICQFWYS